MQRKSKNMKKGWKEISWTDCHECGQNPVEVFTEEPENESVWDGDKARCPDCKQHGGCSVDEDGAFIIWESEH